MRIVDCFVHPVVLPNEQALFAIDAASLQADLPTIAEAMSALKVDRALLALFRPEFHTDAQRTSAERFNVSPLADFRDQNVLERLRYLAECGVRSITFHPYLQDLSRDAWPAALAYAREAARLGMFICVCTAYGSRKIYHIEVLPFATEVAEAVNCPVVFAHCGGAKVIDAMLVADAYPNVFLETSFSLSYWLGSNVEIDMAYAMRKLGVGRWLFGSDAPFVPMAQALDDHFRFFERHGFGDAAIEAIMGGNASKHLGI
jgi:predicted TIM-barrel fold metal-dependent hydrolase